jgi:hypothetical protein
MTSVPHAATPPPAERRGLGVGVGLLTLLVVAYPLLWTVTLTHAAFSGCWISCGAPNPRGGVGYSVWNAFFLGLPFAVGLGVGRVRSRAAWLAAAGFVLLVVVAWALFSMDPGHAELFVERGEN